MLQKLPIDLLFATTKLQPSRPERNQPYSLDTEKLNAQRWHQRRTRRPPTPSFVVPSGLLDGHNVNALQNSRLALVMKSGKGENLRIGDQKIQLLMMP
jgi:hypothetical protein